MAEKTILDKLSIYIPQSKMDQRPVRKRLRSGCYIILAAVFIVAMPTWADSFIMTNPATSSSLFYQDATISIQFILARDTSLLIPDYTRVSFTLLNKTDRAISVNWTSSSFILPSGAASPIIHVGTRYLTAGESQPPTTVPPGSTLDETVAPTRNIQSTSSGWSIARLGLVTGSQFGIYLALDVDGATRGYDFRFKAIQVTAPDKRAYNSMMGVFWVVMGILAVGLVAVLVIYADVMSY